MMMIVMFLEGFKVKDVNLAHTQIVNVFCQCKIQDGRQNYSQNNISACEADIMIILVYLNSFRGQ